MRRFALCWCALTMLGAGSAVAQRQEVGLTLGGLLSTERDNLTLGSGVALQANYGYRLAGGAKAALFGEVHFLASPMRKVASADPALTRDIASLFVTPGVRVKLMPRSAVSPYLAAGGGWALFEQSTMTLDGRPNPAPRTISRGVLDFGVGVDIRLWRFVGLRAEVRDFYSGGPSYNSSSARGGQHNTVAGGGLVLKFR